LLTRQILSASLLVAGCAPVSHAAVDLQSEAATTHKIFSVCEIIADDERLLGRTVTVRAPYTTDYMHYAGLHGPECRRSLMIDVEGRAAPGVDEVRAFLREIRGSDRQLHVTVTGRLKRCDLSDLCVAIVPDSYSEFDGVDLPQQ
jgi:hypothetical protein